MTKMTGTHRAREALIKAGRDYPNAWAQSEAYRAARGEDAAFDWPDWCYVPFAGAYSIVAQGGKTVGFDRLGDVGRIGALSAWRMTQGIYRFDPAVYDAVYATPLGGDLPADVFMRLPEWCVYIETPGASCSFGQLHGFWAHLEHDANTGRKELRFLLDLDDTLLPLPLHLGDWSLSEAIDRVNIQASVNGMPKLEGGHREAFRELLEPLISLLLYVCSTSDLHGKNGRPENPTPTKTRRGGIRLFAADGPRTWDVGVRMGAALRAAYQAAETAGDGGHSGPRGHVRRAHWHGFRTGPRKTVDGAEIPAEKRPFDLRWLPPIPVNLPDVGDLPSTIRPVKT